MPRNLDGEWRLAVLTHGEKCIAHTTKRSADVGHSVLRALQVHRAMPLITLSKLEELLITAQRKLIKSRQEYLI